jgi:glyoxylase-like metal-dependent hydrolase (beta-lactamase superfamily II)
VVNARDPAACAAVWLDQPVLPYCVDQPLAEGDVIGSGLAELHVIHTPGHTLGSISLWEPASRTLTCGDALQADDAPRIGARMEAPAVSSWRR